MVTDVATVVLHGGGHQEGAAVSFEVAFGSLVALLVVLGVLWYVGAFQSPGEGVASLEGQGRGTRSDGDAGDGEAGRGD